MSDLAESPVRLPRDLMDRIDALAEHYPPSAEERLVSGSSKRSRASMTRMCTALGVEEYERRLREGGNRG